MSRDLETWTDLSKIWFLHIPNLYGRPSAGSAVMQLKNLPYMLPEKRPLQVPVPKRVLIVIQGHPNSRTLHCTAANNVGRAGLVVKSNNMVAWEMGQPFGFRFGRGRSTVQIILGSVGPQEWIGLRLRSACLPRRIPHYEGNMRPCVSLQQFRLTPEVASTKGAPDFSEFPKAMRLRLGGERQKELDHGSLHEKDFISRAASVPSTQQRKVEESKVDISRLDMRHRAVSFCPHPGGCKDLHCHKGQMCRCSHAGLGKTLTAVALDEGVVPRD